MIGKPLVTPSRPGRDRVFARRPGKSTGWSGVGASGPSASGAKAFIRSHRACLAHLPQGCWIKLDAEHAAGVTAPHSLARRTGPPLVRLIAAGAHGRSGERRHYGNCPVGHAAAERPTPAVSRAGFSPWSAAGLARRSPGR